MASATAHTALSIFVHDAQLAIQPKGAAPGSQVDTMYINLDTGSVQVVQAPPQQGKALEVLAILGMCKLHAGNALVVVTAARPTAVLAGAHVFEVAGADVLVSSAARKNRANQRLLRLLRNAVDPQESGRGMYFSYDYDLTLTTQRAAAAAAAAPDKWAAQLPVQRADGRFFWNKVIAAPLLAAGAERFVQPCILGFIEQLPGLPFNDITSGKPVTASLTLLARRSNARAGTRQWRRGADTSGAAANFAETEQVLTIDGPAGTPSLGTTCSYVIVRGSIPLLWTQLPNIKYKPTTVIAPSELSGPVHDKHFASMVEQYKSVVAINLVNHHGTEGKLEAAFRSESSRLVGSGSATGQALRYVAFDFHAECSNKRYHRLSLLWDQVAADFETQGFCRTGSGSSAAQQQGVMRINCIDCLDRTNVVQGVMGRKSLESVLVSLGLLPPGTSLPEAYPAVEAQFKILWADHGDALSTQYAGTGAMKSGFTRTGKRTFGGMLDDGVKAVVRYYLNNFQDGVKQDAIDLLTGAYQCDTIHAPPFKSQPSPVLPLVLSLLALGLTAHNLVGVLSAFGLLPAPLARPPSPAASAAADGEAANALDNILRHTRSLLSTVTFPGPVASAGSAGGSEGVGLTINPTAASVAEGAAAPLLAGLGGSILVYVALPLILGAGLLLLVVQNGKHLVNKPQLCPALAVTVTKDMVQKTKKTA